MFSELLLKNIDRFNLLQACFHVGTMSRKIIEEVIFKFWWPGGGEGDVNNKLVSRDYILSLRFPDNILLLSRLGPGTDPNWKILYKIKPECHSNPTKEKKRNR